MAKSKRKATKKKSKPKPKAAGSARDSWPLNAAAIVRDVAARAVTARAIVERAIAAHDRLNESLNAFLHLDRDDALAQADAIDTARDAGEALGPLAGVPVAIKDNISVRGQPCTCASRILEGYTAPYDAHVIDRLRAAGAVIFGRTNLDEFAMGSSGENSAFGPTANPWDVARVPGGSSAGSAAAVAAGIVPLALGSDTGGSVRQPASLCGVVGLKPTYGRVSRYGLVAFGSSLDQIGVLARTVEDADLAYRVIAGHDARDATSLSRARVDGGFDADVKANILPAVPAANTPTVRAKAKPSADAKPLAGLIVGVIAEAFRQAGTEAAGAGAGTAADGNGTSATSGDGASGERGGGRGGPDADVRASVEAAIEALRALGAQTREVSLPHLDAGIAAYYVIADSEASANLSRFDGMRYGARRPLAAEGASMEETFVRTRSEGFGAEVKRRIMLGTFALASGYYDAYYLRACRVRRLLQRDFLAVLRGGDGANAGGGRGDPEGDGDSAAMCDLLVCPTTPTTAFARGEKTADPLAMYLNDVFTVGANLAGTPAVSLPCGLDGQGLPIGVQLIAPMLGEAALLHAAASLAGALNFADRPNL